jgi:Raf kinase inhibitor-like YbhB/YbcL family protein
MNVRAKTWLRRVVIALLGVVLTCAASILWLRHKNLADAAGGPVKGSLAVSSPNFADGGRIPAKFACDKAISPALWWTEPPTGTQSIAIVMEDPDAPFGFIHWISYGLPSSTRAISEGASSNPPDGAKQGKNSSGEIGYVGPCPPFGSHHYIFRVYAVDSNIELPPGATKEQLTAAIRGHVLAEGKIAGIYRRSSEAGN